jgi:hypothetical protein
MTRFVAYLSIPLSSCLGLICLDKIFLGFMLSFRLWIETNSHECDSIKSYRIARFAITQVQSSDEK